MEKVHNHSNCPACSANLSGEEYHCPFCGYRIVFENNIEPIILGETTTELNPAETDNFNGSLSSDEQSNLSLENTLDKKDQYTPPEIVKVDKVDGIKISQENNISEFSTNIVVTAEDSEINEPQDSNSENNDKEKELISEEISLLNDDEAENEEKKVKKRKIITNIIVFAVFILVALGALTILHYYDKVDVFFLPDRNNGNSKTSKTVSIIEKNYYFCYSTGKINKKKLVVFSKIFKLEEKGNNEILSSKKFNETIKKSISVNTDNLDTTICKKFNNPVSAYKEKNIIMDKYLKQKYSFRFVEIK